MREIVRRSGSSRRCRATASAVMAVAATLALAACGGGGDSAVGAGGGGTLTYGLSQAPDSLNPAKGVYDPDREISSDPLLRMAKDGTVGPALATKWGYVGKGNKTFELTLRHGVKFSDGTPLDAAAVKSWLEYFEQAKNSYVALMGKIDSIETPDDSTVRINLAQANPIVPQLLTNHFSWGSVQSPTALKNPKSLDAKPVGAGPYALDSGQSVTGDHYTYVPNKYYYDKSRIHWNKIVTRVIANPSSRLQALQTGQIQGAAGEYSTMGPATKAGLQVFPYRVIEQAFLITDAGGQVVKPLGDVRVRQALNYAIDRKTLVKAVYPDGGKTTSQFATLDGQNPAVDDLYPYDPQKAKQLLAQAGYPNGFNVKVMSLNFTGPDFQNVMQATADYWDKIGVKVDIQPANNLTDYMGSLNGSASLVQAAPQYSFPMFASYPSYMAPGGIFHPRNWKDATLQKLYAEGSTAADPKPIWQQMTKVIAEQAYAIPIMTPPSAVYAAKNISGVVVSDVRYNPVLPDWQLKK
jgi:peptide/nickel transport system substrate-binding protein